MRLKLIVKNALLMPARIVPLAVGYRMVWWWVKALARRKDDRKVMSHLLELEDLLGSQTDLCAVRYDRGVHVKHRLTRYHDFFTQRIGPGEVVADIGCGIGALAFSIAQQCGAVVTAIDMAEANLQVARENFSHQNITYLYQDALAWQPTCRFQTIVLSNVLEHIEQRVEFLRKTQTALGPQRWLIRVPRFDRDWRTALKEELGLFAYGDPTHFTEYTPESFAAEMADAGLEIEHVESRWSELWAEVRAARR